MHSWAASECSPQTAAAWLKAGEIAFIPKGVVHAIHNPSTRPMTFLTILSPAQAKGLFLVNCYNDEPWCSLRKPFAYRAGIPGPAAHELQPWQDNPDEGQQPADRSLPAPSRV